MNEFYDYISSSNEVDLRIEISKNDYITNFQQIFQNDIPSINTFDKQVAIIYNYKDIESLLICKMVSDSLLECGIVLIHGAAIDVKHKCYIFVAPSGTGKTTHILNWKKLFPETIIINGDKPLINTETKLVYGTPWCGKEGFNTNTSSPLAGIIALQRGEENFIKPITFHEMLPTLLQQTYIPKQTELALKAYSLIGKFKDIPCYKLTCNMDEKSARIAYAGIKASEEKWEHS